MPYDPDAGEIPKRIHTRFKTRRKFEIKNLRSYFLPENFQTKAFNQFLFPLVMAESGLRTSVFIYCVGLEQYCYKCSLLIRKF